MAGTEWLRTFLAVYRSGSVTEGARHRGLTQPAASQQLASLERAAGGPLFVRRSTGVVPTRLGRELYGDVAGPLDGLEPVLRGLDAGRVQATEVPLRVGSSPELFAAELLPRMVASDAPVAVTFGDDGELWSAVQHGELDLAVTTGMPPRTSVDAVPVGTRRFALLAAPGSGPVAPFDTLTELADWLADQPWATYSLELPVTRRFWISVLGRPFPVRPRLVAPDLRVVLRAVELGVGVSLLPTFVCRDALVEGRVVEIHPVSDLAPQEPWFACTAAGGAVRPAVAAMVAELSGLGVVDHPVAADGPVAGDRPVAGDGPVATAR